MTGPLLKCWIIDYKKPTSCESWDLQKLFDSSEKVKANFKTEIKVARNERMWSQAWNPGFPSHKNSSTSQPADYHRDSQKQNCSLERQYWGKHLNAREMISERSICQNRHPMPLLQYKNLKRASSTTGYFFHFFLSLDRFMLEGHPEGSKPLLQMTHQSPSHVVSLVSGPHYELALSQDALPRFALKLIFRNCIHFNFKVNET